MTAPDHRTGQRTPLDAVPGTSAPLRGALAEAGYPDLESLDGADYATLKALHGVGARGLERLQAALLEKGLSFSGTIPAPRGNEVTVTAGHTGVVASDIKTKPTNVSPAEYIETLDTARRVEHGRLLLELFTRVTGAEPVMWGPSMIGYGETHYVSAAGREGDWFHVGFSPRKAKLSLYGLTSHPGYEQQLQRLGKHTVGASCLYVNKPEDIDLAVLEEMLTDAWNAQPQGC